LGDRKDIWPVKIYVTYPQGSVPVEVEEEKREEPANSGSPGNGR